MNCRECLLAGVAILLVGLLTLGVFTITAGHFLATEDAISQADAIVVLGGDGGDFFRVQQGVDLFNEGCAPVVVFSGGISLKDAGLACSSAQLSLETAQELGLPDGAAIIASGAQSTYDEAVNLRRLAQQHRWHGIIVVTDLFHTRRAARTFRTLLPDTTIYLSATPDPRYDAGRWSSRRSTCCATPSSFGWMIGPTRSPRSMRNWWTRAMLHPSSRGCATWKTSGEGASPFGQPPPGVSTEI